MGCGNLAWHLTAHLQSLKKFDLFVYNHKANKNLAEFKTKLGCKTQSNFKNIIKDADYYLICVADRSISAVSNKINSTKTNALVLHTSGSVSIKEIKGNYKNKAVLYPLQTFSKQDKLNWAEVPFIVEGNNEHNLKNAEELAHLFSKTVLQLNSAERLKLHLAAVLVNNFTNALYNEADKFISEKIKNNSVNFNMLLPIINQSVLKLKSMTPAAAQTGPSKRGDEKIMKQHLRLLKNSNLKKVYKQLSALISKQK